MAFFLKEKPSGSDLVSPSEAIKAIEALSDNENENEAISALSDILRNEMDLVARSLAAEMLVKYKEHVSVPSILSEILVNPSEGSLVRCATARALGKVGGEQALDALIKSIETDNNYPLVITNSIRALGDIGDPKAIPSVTKLFSSMEDPRCPPYLIRTWAAESLGQIGAYKGAVILKRAYEGDSHSSVREAAEKALHEIAKRNDISSIQELLNTINDT